MAKYGEKAQEKVEKVMYEMNEKSKTRSKTSAKKSANDHAKSSETKSKSSSAKSSPRKKSTVTTGSESSRSRASSGRQKVARSRNRETFMEQAEEAVVKGWDAITDVAKGAVEFVEESFGMTPKKRSRKTSSISKSIKGKVQKGIKTITDVPNIILVK